ncbi:adenylate/guanylate cyclase domain-containing protein [Mycobacterium shimoidei]|uniref:adenylate/guanylate cyclase domain-containing protein n=1 Tax=Mycobacterium shimoidei TaxID=29313 RepID=UPI000848AE46|nr:adenylate/guanylate cyclase domain-containing protein [Mycobacterium shimoidei]MCV7257131.1 AAA family ATPase [Mycobacterium shimoidei]ODR09946.1 cyclase [Mycobacterium shimoidei]ORW80593.1 cyclase [Mycobacterium shimoidei]
MTAGVICGSCGAGLREKAKFCDECGSRIASSADTAEYKQVTVLFADMVRSMDIAAAVDMERLREIMTEMLERLASVVQRYGGGRVEYTGDGLMAIFGAPVALEDHAFRGCLAALAMQQEANRLAEEVQRHDGVALRLRVGLNSGRVIAGELGSGSLGYRAVGETVGFAQRMESAAPPGAVMLSESTAQLVEHLAMLGEPESVRVKGADEPVRARRLVRIGPREGLVGPAETSLVGRRWEMAALEAMLDRAVGGRGGAVTVMGPPGIGKSRVAREVAALAAGRGVEVYWAFCESHAVDISFGVVAQVLRSASGVAGLDGPAARARLHAAMPDADPQDLLLLEDLLGVADPEVPLPAIDPDARRRRLSALVNTAALVRTRPVLYIIEDAHWIDAVSESMLADLFTVIPRTPSMVLITTRPEYRGALTRAPGFQTIALGPLGDSDIAALMSELLGTDPSVSELAAIIAERAAGNPFFAEEMVRELVQRGVLSGARGSHVCQANVAELSVPATVQAAIEARIDRLAPAAKRTLTAASVIGARFEAELLVALGIDPVVDDLLRAELIDQVRFTPRPEYAFHHPLIRTVAYESQLKSDRAQWHRRLAAAIQQREPGSVEDNAALIAEHLESAGDPHAAYDWHMRAAAWSTIRDLDAARLSWERARRIADTLPADDPGQLSMRIAPRTMLCATEWHGRFVQDRRSRFAELRELCTAAGDKVSLAIGMSALASELAYAGRSREGSRLVSEQLALLESIGDPTLTVGLAIVVLLNWADSGEFDKILRWSQTVIDLAAGDPAMGADFGIGSPLAVTLTWRGIARYWLGRPGWRQDFQDAVDMAQNSDPATLATVVAWTYGWSIHYGVLRADDFKVQAIEGAVQTAERAGNDTALSVAKYGLGGVLLMSDAAADRRRGLELISQARDIWQRKQVGLQMLQIVESWTARERAGQGDRDAAIAVMRKAVDELHQAERLGLGLLGTGFLVEALLERGAEGDLAEAQAEIDRLTKLRADQGPAMRKITLLRLRALLARARGDDVGYRDLVNRYREMAESLGFEGHITWAEAMIECTE